MMMVTTMKVDAEIKVLGFEILTRHLGLVEAERFVTLIQREKFDYTRWRQNLFAGLNGEEISHRAMEFHRGKSGAV
jgi:hypothetical protein